jgi:hypothetical protein
VPCRINGGRYAVKIFKTTGTLTPMAVRVLRQEVEIMRSMDHPGIIRLQEVRGRKWRHGRHCFRRSLAPPLTTMLQHTICRCGIVRHTGDSARSI